MPEISSQEQMKSSYSYFMTRSQCYIEMKSAILSGTLGPSEFDHKGTVGLMLRGTTEARLQHVHPLVGTFRGTGLLAKSIEMDCVLSLCMKYVCAAQRISNSFAHRGTLKSFSAETH